MTAERVEQALLAVGMAGPVVFNAGYLINGAVQPGYSCRRHTISTLSLGQHGWIQDASFTVYGMSTACLAVGLRRSRAIGAPGFALLGVAGVGLIVVGHFPSDPILGFPPGQPTVATPRGTVHNIASLAVFLAFPAAALSTVRRPLRAWEMFSLASAVASLVGVARFFAAVAAAGEEPGGTCRAGGRERSPALIIGAWQIASGLRSMTRHGRSR
jgi:hypothetical membrane protein